MSVNSSSSNSSIHPLINMCFRSEISILVFSAFSITNLLLLPLYILVLYLGYQQWRQESSVSAAAASHSDLFTYNAIIMQLIEFLGLSFLFCGRYNNLVDMTWIGLNALFVTSTGQAMFHILTCVEHYLAVVHPVTYLHLRQAGEFKIRNISTACAWLITFGWLAAYYIGSFEFNLILYLCIMGFYLVVISFCSISVLCALKHPKPGEVGGKKEQCDQSKQRAFYTILAIMGVFLFRFLENVVGNVIYNSAKLGPSIICVVLMSTVWLDLPSSLVLPLLFLHRAGKLQCCKQHSESG